MSKEEIYCVKCRHKCTPKTVTFGRDRRGRLRLKGTCPHCGTKCYKYVSERLSENLVE